MSDMDEIVREFVVESLEGLDQVDAELLVLEARPNDEEVLQSIFRTIHSMKGACGFLEFSVLERLAHAGENLLDALREGSIAPADSLITTLLEMNDGIRSLLSTIEESGTDESGPDFSDLVAKLHQILQDGRSAKAMASEGSAAPADAQPATEEDSPAEEVSETPAEVSREQAPEPSATPAEF